MKKVISGILALVLSLSLSVAVFAEESDIITKEQANTYARELIDMFNSSTEVEMFDGDTIGTWYAFTPYLADILYKNPDAYYDIYDAWKVGTDPYSGLYTPERYDENYVSNDEEKLDITLDGNVGYLKIADFRDGTHTKFIEAYDNALDKGMKSIIFDLRGNPGGLANPAFDMINHIIPEILPTYTFIQKHNISFAYSDGFGDKTRRPDIVILIDKDTGSAAELFAAVLQYHGYARVIGETSYGKGIGQSNIQLGDETILAVTALYIALPDGSTWNKVGVTPDAEVTDDPATEADEVLDFAEKIVDGIGHTPRESAYLTFNIPLAKDDDYIDLDSFALVKQNEAMLAKPLRYGFISSNGVKMTVDPLEVFQAAHTKYYFGVYADQSQAAKNILMQQGLSETAEVISTVAEGDLGFTATISAQMKTEPKYFYYYDSVNDKYTEFKPASSYSDGVIRFNIKKGGIIVLSPSSLDTL
jgi:hypothetical protein